MNSSTCPCGSQKPYQNCCALYLEQGLNAETAQQLMRSRYCAYQQQNINYLLATWHNSTRPDNLEPEDLTLTHWKQLYIVATILGGINDDSGSVEFVAYFSSNNVLQKLHEISQFKKQENRWFYVDGEIMVNSKFQPSRNSPCYCGSGKKFKHCCLN